MDKLYFQWHITNRCNYRCRHCYQGDFTEKDELGWDGLRRVADRIIEACGSSKEAVIDLTGGEPFLKEEFFELVSYLDGHKEIGELGIITNGSLIDLDLARRLNEFPKLRRMKVSLEGAEAQTNDFVRGAGAFCRATSALETLKKNTRFSTIIMFTAMKRNADQVKGLFRLARDMGIDGIIIERFFPMGAGAKMKDQLLEADDWRKLVNDLLEAAGVECSDEELLPYRAFWAKFTEGEASLMGADCNVGRDAFAIMPNGDLYPCRRFNSKIGNLLDTSLEDIVGSSKVLTDLGRERREGFCHAMAYLLMGRKVKLIIAGLFFSLAILQATASWGDDKEHVPPGNKPPVINPGAPQEFLPVNSFRLTKAEEEEIARLIKDLGGKLSTVERVVNQLGKIGEKAIPQLLNALNSGSENADSREVRSNAAWALGAIGEKAIPYLSEAMKSTNPKIRSGAISALGYIGEKAEPLTIRIIEALKDGDDDVISRAGWALRNMGEKAIPVLIQASKDKNANVRYYAAEALYRISEKYYEKTLPYLTDALKDDSPDAREMSAMVMSRIGGRAVEEKFIEVLLSSAYDERLRSYVAFLISKFSDSKKSALLANEVLRQHIKGLDSKGEKFDPKVLDYIFGDSSQPGMLSGSKYSHEPALALLGYSHDPALSGEIRNALAGKLTKFLDKNEKLLSLANFVRGLKEIALSKTCSIALKKGAIELLSKTAEGHCKLIELASEYRDEPKKRDYLLLVLSNERFKVNLSKLSAIELNTLIELYISTNLLNPHASFYIISALEKNPGLGMSDLEINDRLARALEDRIKDAKAANETFIRLYVYSRKTASVKLFSSFLKRKDISEDDTALLAKAYVYNSSLSNDDILEIWKAWLSEVTSNIDNEHYQLNAYVLFSALDYYGGDKDDLYGKLMKETLANPPRGLPEKTAASLLNLLKEVLRDGYFYEKHGVKRKQ